MFLPTIYFLPRSPHLEGRCSISASSCTQNQVEVHTGISSMLLEYASFFAEYVVSVKDCACIHECVRINVCILTLAVLLSVTNTPIIYSLYFYYAI